MDADYVHPISVDVSDFFEACGFSATQKVFPVVQLTLLLKAEKLARCGFFFRCSQKAAQRFCGIVQLSESKFLYAFYSISRKKIFPFIAIVLFFPQGMRKFLPFFSFLHFSLC